MATRTTNGRLINSERRKHPIVPYTNGIVDFNQDNCIGCQYCVTGCPFDIPRYDARVPCFAYHDILPAFIT